MLVLVLYGLKIKFIMKKLAPMRGMIIDRN